MYIQNDSFIVLTLFPLCIFTVSFFKLTILYKYIVSNVWKSKSVTKYVYIIQKNKIFCDFIASCCQQSFQIPIRDLCTWLGIVYIFFCQKPITITFAVGIYLNNPEYFYPRSQWYIGTIPSRQIFVWLNYTIRLYFESNFSINILLSMDCVIHWNYKACIQKLYQLLN